MINHIILILQGCAKVGLKLYEKRHTGYDYNDTRISSGFCVLTAVNLLWPIFAFMLLTKYKLHWGHYRASPFPIFQFIILKIHFK